MEYRAVGSGDVFALDEDDGTKTPIDENGFVTLGVDTYLFPLSVPEATAYSIHIQTDGVIAGTFTIEQSNMPKTKDDMGQTADITDWDNATVGAWVPVNQAVSSSSYVNTNGTGWTATVFSLAKTAGTGGAIVNFAGLAIKRLRLKAVITTGGKVRVNRHSKA